MKKILFVKLLIFVLILSSVNCFAFMRLRDVTSSSYLDKNGNEIYLTYTSDDPKPNTKNLEPYGGSDHIQEIVTNEFIYKNGTAMIKLKDAISVLKGSGSVEYNPINKSVKIYLQDYIYNIKSALIYDKNNTITYTTCHGDYSTQTAKVTPEIINGSMYISAIDFYHLMQPRGEKYHFTYYTVYSRKVTIQKGILYIPFDGCWD